MAEAMTPTQWFAFVILPVVVVAGAGGLTLLHDWYQRRLDAKEGRRQ